jgi:hypothetical protein
VLAIEGERVVAQHPGDGIQAPLQLVAVLLSASTGDGQTKRVPTHVASDLNPAVGVIE